MASQRTIECACCGQPGRLGSRGLIVNCESRIRKYHRDELADFPRQLRARVDMLDDYATWRLRRPEATQQEIADEMGVTRSALRRALDRDRARARDETTAPQGQEETTMGKFSDAVGGFMQGLQGETAPAGYAYDGTPLSSLGESFDPNYRAGTDRDGFIRPIVSATPEGAQAWLAEAEAGRRSIPHDLFMDQRQYDLLCGDPFGTQRLADERNGRPFDGREEDAAAALMSSSSWRDASPEEREAARERWLGEEVDDAVESSHRWAAGDEATADRVKAAGGECRADSVSRESAAQVQASRDAGWIPPVGYEYQRPDVSRENFDGYSEHEDRSDDRSNVREL